MNKEQFESITKWQTETFGQATAMSKLHHLAEEIVELSAALKEGGQGNIEKEFADCFILMFGCASSYGISYDGICKLIDDKMIINRGRKWGKPNENGVVNHIK